MNNKEFRQLVLDTPQRPQDGSSAVAATPRATPGSLGSRMRSSIPMTPSVTGIDLAMLATYILTP